MLSKTWQVTQQLKINSYSLKIMSSSEFRVVWQVCLRIFCFVIFFDLAPSLVFDFSDLSENRFLLSLLSLPRGALYESQFVHLIFLHESALHPALQVVDLERSASFGHKLMLGDTIRIQSGLSVTLVEVVQRERTTIRGFGHADSL